MDEASFLRGFYVNQGLGDNLHAFVVARTITDKRDKPNKNVDYGWFITN